MRRSKYLALIAVAFMAFGLASADVAKGAKGEVRLKTGKTASLTLKQPTRVADVVLPPGDYQVRDRASSAGRLVEFVRIVFNPYVGDSGLSPYDYQIVARVPTSIEALSTNVRHTNIETVPASAGNRLVCMEIRGENVAYRFTENGPDTNRAMMAAANTQSCFAH